MSSIYKKSSGTPWQTVAGETIIIDPSRQYSHEMGDTASFIWSRIDGSHTIEQIVDDLCLQYVVSPEQATTDVVEFLTVLEQKGLVCLN